MYLTHCGSAAHRAVAGLLVLAVAGRRTPGLADSLSAIDPMAIAEIAQSHYVDTELASAFARDADLATRVPEDLAIFFREMQGANRRRNAALGAQLASIGTAMASEGVALVALKGAAILAGDEAGAAGRYISDLDLLVAEDEADRALGVLERIGGRSRPSEVLPGTHHHLPQVMAEGWAAPVELHVALGGAAVRRLLPASDVLDGAAPSDVPGIALPTPALRIAHLAVHGLVSSHPMAARSFSLRDIAGYERLRRRVGSVVVAEAHGRLAEAGGRDILPALEALSAAVFDRAPDAISTPRGMAWARQALSRFGEPERRRRAETAQWAIRNIREIVTDADRRRHIAGLIAAPGGLRGAVERQKARNGLLR